MTEKRPDVLEPWRRALVSPPPGRRRGPVRAAVAVVLRAGPHDAEVLLVQRAHRAGDPWSGQMALPGGRCAPADEDTVATALRETREEVGLDLRAHGRLLGRLPDQRVMARGRPVGWLVRPFVFEWWGQQAPKPNQEVDRWWWVPLEPLRRGERHARYPYRLRLGRITLPIEMPAYRVEGRLVWGLTHRILRSLLRLREAPEGNRLHAATGLPPHRRRP